MSHHDLTSNDGWLREWNLDRAESDPRQPWVMPCDPLEVCYGVDPLAFVLFAGASVRLFVVVKKVLERHPQLELVGGGGER